MNIEEIIKGHDEKELREIVDTTISAVPDKYKNICIEFCEISTLTTSSYLITHYYGAIKKLKTAVLSEMSEGYKKHNTKVFFLALLRIIELRKDKLDREIYRDED